MRAARLIRETITLRDGQRVTLRPIRKSDAPGLIDFHNRLSSDSRYFRFFGPKPDLSVSEAAYLADVDFRDRFAIVAVGSDGSILAVARFDLVDDQTAEPAIVVRDDYHGLGIGTALLERMLQVGRGRGVRRFKAEVLAENTKMLDLLRSDDLDANAVDGVVTVKGRIDDSGRVFRAFAVIARYATDIQARQPLKRPRDD